MKDLLWQGMKSCRVLGVRGEIPRKHKQGVKSPPSLPAQYVAPHPKLIWNPTLGSQVGSETGTDGFCFSSLAD